MWIYEADVEHLVGQFPLDMLRYDTCYSTDPGVVSNISVQDTGEKRVTTRVATFTYTKYVYWTTNRWLSFGVYIKNISSHKVD